MAANNLPEARLKGLRWVLRSNTQHMLAQRFCGSFVVRFVTSPVSPTKHAMLWSRHAPGKAGTYGAEGLDKLEDAARGLNTDDDEARFDDRAGSW